MEGLNKTQRSFQKGIVPIGYHIRRLSSAEKCGVWESPTERLRQEKEELERCMSHTCMYMQTETEQREEKGASGEVKTQPQPRQSSIRAIIPTNLLGWNFIEDGICPSTVAPQWENI